MSNDPVEVTLEVTQVLEALDVQYLIGGSLASTLYGMVRTTQDSDIVAEMQLTHVQKFVAALQDIFCFDAVASAKFASPKDTIIAKLEWYRMGGEVSERQWRTSGVWGKLRPGAWFRRERGGAEAPCSPARSPGGLFAPQFLLMRIYDRSTARTRAARMGLVLASEALQRRCVPRTPDTRRQWRDILGVLKTRASTIDVAYLRTWAAELNVSDLLERALRASS
jgi:hypothetical protein